MKIKAVLFDLDGVLVDATEWHYDALNRALSLFGYNISRYEHLTTYNGLPTRKKLEMLSVEKNFPRGLHALTNKIKQKYTREEILRNCTPSFDKEFMVHQLKREGYQIACCSNSIRESVELMLCGSGIFDLFDFICSNEDVKNPKPNPEMYLCAFKKLRLKPKDCVIVEDAGHGIEAAKRSGGHLCQVTGFGDVDYPRIHSFIESVEKRRQIMLQIVVPMGGKASRFQERGYTFPKPLIEIGSQSMIEVVLSNLAPPQPNQFTFICRKEHLSKFYLGDMLRLVAPGCRIIPLEQDTAGALCSVLLAIDELDPDEELLIANGDQFITSGISSFYEACRQPKIDGCILTFTATHPRWSFVKTDASGFVTGTAEKRPISKQATAGLYYFRRARDLIEGSEKMIVKGLSTSGQFFVCPVYNELILAGKKITTHHLPEGAMHSLGTPEDVDLFLKEFGAGHKLMLKGK